jgi:hypothetical protein
MQTEILTQTLTLPLARPATPAAQAAPAGAAEAQAGAGAAAAARGAPPAPASAPVPFPRPRSASDVVEPSRPSEPQGAPHMGVLLWGWQRLAAPTHSSTGTLIFAAVFWCTGG